MRPSNPTPFQRYYDTDIDVEIWWERGAWRTVAGNAGDVKRAKATSLSAAITDNPGWVSTSKNIPDQAIIVNKSEECPVPVLPGGPWANDTWQSRDITSWLNSKGLSGALYVFLSLEAVVERTGFVTQSQETRMYAASSNSAGSPTSNMARAYSQSDNSSTRDSDNTFASIKLLDGHTFWWKIYWYNCNPNGQVCVLGCVYDPLIHVIGGTEFLLKKL